VISGSFPQQRLILFSPSAPPPWVYIIACCLCSAPDASSVLNVPVLNKELEVCITLA
jgi:hypothetical protein